MTPRDRLMLMAIALVAVLGGGWMLAVSPARKQASQASGEVVSARSQLAQAQSEVAEARSAQSRYHSAYASLASLGQAVPTSPEVPALVYALDKTSNSHNVEFTSISNGSSGSGSSSPSAPASASASAATTASPFTQMPFTFTFAGGYQGLIHLLTQLERFTVQSPGGPLEVSGRLLTIQSITLGAAGQSSASSGTAAAQPSHQMAWTITASAYVLAPAPLGASVPPAGGSGSHAPGAPGAGAAAPATPAVVRTNG